MKLNELVEKMKKNLDNGTYGLIEYRINQVNEIKSSENGIDYIKKCNLLDEIYEFISGMLWGLYGVGFISENERIILVHELVELTKQA